MVAPRPRQRPYTSRRPPDEPVIVDVEHRRLAALDAARPRSAGSSGTWADRAAARPVSEELWPGAAPARHSRAGGQVSHPISLSEWAAAGVALGDGPPGPEAIPGTILNRPASRRPRRRPARRHWMGADSLAWSGSGAALSAPLDSYPSAIHSPPPALSWWWPFYLLLCGPFLALKRVRRPQRAIPRTLLVVAAVTGVLVLVALLVELPQRRGSAVLAPVQPTTIGSGAGTDDGAKTPPRGGTPAQDASAASVGGWVTVANTDGQGLYLRRQPDWSSKWVAWREGTNLHVLATGVNGTGAPSTSGAAWLQVRDPEGRVGYVPEQYVTLAARP